MSSATSKQNRPENSYFKNGVDYSWQATAEFNTLVKQFRDTCTLSPRGPDIKEARRMHKVIIDELQKKLSDRKDLRCVRLEYTGSAYEEVNVSKGPDDDDLEFDIMVIIEGGRELKKVPEGNTPPGYVLLQPIEGDSVKRFQKQITEGYLSGDKVAARFMSHLRVCIGEIQAENAGKEDGLEELKNIKDNITLRQHGPAIQMDIHRTQPDVPKQKNLFYSVDMVPTFEIKTPQRQEEYYVAKPLKGVNLADNPTLRFAWRRSFSLDEKSELKTADENNTCKKAIFRILKVIRNRESGLAQLSSYHLKTVLLREVRSRNNDSEWIEEHIGKRLMNVLSRLVDELCSEDIGLVADSKSVKNGEQQRPRAVKGRMPHHYIPTMNLLDGIDEATCRCMYYRFKHLKNSQKQMENLLKKEIERRIDRSGSLKDDSEPVSKLEGEALVDCETSERKKTDAPKKKRNSGSNRISTPSV